MTTQSDRRGYLLVTLCYWAFTLSDGALRMLVLMHLHAQGQTAWALALILLPYEVAGVATNLLGGYLNARVGMKATLTLGLALQVAACIMLASDPANMSVLFVAASQCLSGVAKDMAKTSAKSYVKALRTPGDSAGLFRWVAWMTGSKNAMKGAGFFVGGALLSCAGFRATNYGIAALLALFTCAAAWTLPRVPGRRGVTIGSVLTHDARMWWLSVARMFLFGSRDAWFAVALPLFLIRSGWPQPAVGGALAAWVILYGAIQSATPRLTGARTASAGTRWALTWTSLLLAPLATGALALPSSARPVLLATLTLVAYGAVFAVTSSLHSWLVVALHDDDRNAERVGFYYAANAAGRVLGTLASGLFFSGACTSAEGLAWCMHASCLSAAAAAACTGALRRRVTTTA